jgi:hypothetical protein
LDCSYTGISCEMFNEEKCCENCQLLDDFLTEEFTNNLQPDFLVL